MVKHLLNFYSEKILSRWTVLVFDTVIITISFLAAYLLRFNFDYSLIDPNKVKLQLEIITIIYLSTFLITQSNTGILRHTGLLDAFRILYALIFALLITIIFNVFINFSGFNNDYLIPYSILIIHFLLSLFILIGFRVSIKIIYSKLNQKYSEKKISVLIYGAGDAGLLTKNALEKDYKNRYHIVAFIDDNITKINKRLEDIPIITQKKALCASYIKNYNISQLIIAIQNINTEKKNIIVEKGLNFHLEVKVVPSINLWINGQLSSKQLRRVEIEDLLEREPIKLDNENIRREIKDKIIMVTGGAGSIGSEIVRQILNYSPKQILVIDQAESAIFDLQFEIKNSKIYQKSINCIEFIVADIKDKFRMDCLLKAYHPDIIYHAAAYKHVPLMEDNPYEALLVNVFGTKTIADLSIKYDVGKFVMISTDKAVNPSNVMGASKRIAETYIQSIKNTKTKFITTRFGNVLGSNGSVVPLFRKQIESGGPVTITHKEITRFFMTIPEACNLVLEAGAIGKGSDIFVFDMGEPVKIYDMAKKMIRLFGYEPDIDILIKEIGLRPGEKLYEELLANNENNLPTNNPKILRAKVASHSYDKVCNFINELSGLIIEDNDYALVSKMKQIVPEYISNNSVFEKLDKKPMSFRRTK